MTRALRIVRVMPYFEPASRFGGCVAQAGATSARLAARGNRVDVVTSDLGVGPELPRDTWVERDGYRVYYATARGAQQRPPYPSPRIDGVLAERLQSADLLCLNVGLTLLNARARRLAHRAGVPYVYNAEGALCPFRLGRKRLRKRLFVRAFERRVLRDAAALHAVTDKEAADLVRLGAPRARVHVVPNGVALNDAEPAPARDAFRARLGVPHDALVVLFLGRLDPIKGLGLLLSAAAPLLEEIAALHLVIAGPDDGCRARLERRVAALQLRHRVAFPGMLGAHERRLALSAADVFALTSYSEGLPLAALEAAAAGLPLLLTDRCNVPEVAVYGAGRVEPPDETRLRAALRTLATDAAARRHCASQARRMARECFALDHVVDRLEALYRSVAS